MSQCAYCESRILLGLAAVPRAAEPSSMRIKVRRRQRRARPVTLATWTASIAARPPTAPLTPAGQRGDELATAALYPPTRVAHEPRISSLGRNHRRWPVRGSREGVGSRY
jgi:hypothetical protein